MKSVFFLTWRYMVFNKGKSLILALSTTVLIMLPLTFNRLVFHYHNVLLKRASLTPVVVGERANRYDLILKSIYFYTQYSGHINMGEVEYLEKKGYGQAIPLRIKFNGQKFHETGEGVERASTVPIVGTELGYFDFRGLKIKEGTLPLLLGDAVLGAEAAEILDVKVGESVLTTPTSAYDQAQSFQLKMPVVGILEGTGTPDDRAVFVDLKTSWVIEGIGHGHENILSVEDSALINADRSSDSNIVTTSQILQYQEITDENRNSFHFHGDSRELPITSVILVPTDRKQNTLARSDYNLNANRSYLIPSEVMEELMGFVFKVRQFMNANYTLILTAAVLLVGMIFSLSYRLRLKEMQTLEKLGCSKSMQVGVVAAEIVFILLISCAVSFFVSWIFVMYSGKLLMLLLS